LITFNTLSLTNAPKLKKIDKFFFKIEKYFKKISPICRKPCFRLDFRRFDDLNTKPLDAGFSGTYEFQRRNNVAFGCLE
jgi:hypothetical protein